MENSIYTVDYFIKKFTAIPEEKWCLNTRADGNGARCALGWCYPNDRIAKASENFGNEGIPYSAEDDALSALFNLLPYPWVGGTNNGLQECPYKQPTAKQRILAALADVKKLQQPEVVERIVYVMVDSTVKELSGQLTNN